MRRLTLTVTAALLTLLALAPPAWADWVWPLRGEVITPYRNGADPYAGGQHRGIDIAGDLGAPVVAAAPGVVQFVGTAGSSGLTVNVRTAEGYDTSYLHLSSVSVREGEPLAAGARVGAVGTTGVRSAERPHLHFGVRDAGSRHGYHDPLAFLPPLPPPAESPRGVPVPQPAPAPVAPAPAPVRVPARERAPTRSPDGHRVPATRPMPAPRRAPAGRRVPAGRRGRAPRRAPAGRRVPSGHGVTADGRVPADGRVRAGGRAPADQRAPADRRAPADGRVPAGQSAPSARIAPVRPGAPRTYSPHRRAPGDAWAHVARPLTAAAPSHARGRDHSGADRHARAENRARIGSTLASEDPASAAADGRTDAARPPAEPRPESRPAPGPDLGLVLACLGLLAAAALLGFSEDGRTATRRGGRQLAARLRPLLGRR